GQDSKRLQVRVEKLGLSAWVRRMGYLEQNELRLVYRLASAFVFPSLCEGFGFPLLEAMASGVPVVASLTSAIPEVCGDAAEFFPPDDPEGMARKIILVLEDSETREQLIARGKKRVGAFRWEKAAGETLAFYKALVEG
ncbi:MAG: glycosyltransferase family 4 protein, partial [Candidatus Aminicenantes bacterium]|nr:glycosyltransferase family 4 protein [Candidatus Aminicenantes bacterium]